MQPVHTPTWGQTRPAKKLALFVAFLGLVVFCSLSLPFNKASADQLSSAKAEAQAISNQLSNDMNQLDQLSASYSQAENNLVSVNNEIAINKSQIQSLQAQIASEQAQLRIEALNAYINATGGNSATSLLYANNKTVGLNQEYLSSASNDINDTITRIKVSNDELSHAQAQLDALASQAQALVATLENDKAQAQQKVNQEKALLNGANAQVQQLIAQQQRAQAEARAALVAKEYKSKTTTLFQNNPPPSGASANVIQLAMSYVGHPYAWGGAGPVGFDCSGLTMTVLAALGISLPHNAQAQYYNTAPVSLNPASWQPGDLIFYGSSTSNIYHVALYIGNGMTVQAGDATTGVAEEPVYWAGPVVAVGAP